jgi:hypothetical protein
VRGIQVRGELLLGFFYGPNDQDFLQVCWNQGWLKVLLGFKVVISGGEKIKS